MKGFSLIELLVVILLLGILATIVFPNFTSLKDHSKTVEAKTALASLARSEQSYFFANGEYSDDLEKIDFNFEPSFYRIGFASSSGKKTYRGPSGVRTSVHQNCRLTSNGFKAGSSNDESLTNFTIEQKGCLRELTKGSHDCNRPIEPKKCL